MNTLTNGTSIDIQITDLAKGGGDGVGRQGNRVIFVAQGVPGDKLKIKITKIKSKWAHGEIQKIIEASKDRIIPKCPIFEKCGGCQYQNITYKKQCQIKKNQVFEILSRIGKLRNININDVIESEMYNYRNKVTYPIRKSNNRIKIGYYEKNSHNVIDLDDKCPVQYSILDKIYNLIKKDIITGNYQIYNEMINNEGIRHLGMRVNNDKNEVLITFVLTSKAIIRDIKDLAKKWTKAFPCIVGICINLNNKKTNTIFGNETICVFGRSYINENFHGLKFQITSTTFFQVNSKQAEKMVYLILEKLKLKGSEYVVDAYCGIGTLALPVANKLNNSGGYVLAIDSFGESIEHGIKNAKINNIKNIKFQKGKVEDVLISYDFDKIPDIVILDPPRKGCHEKVIKRLLKLKPKKIVYISCNPSTLARDLDLLCNNDSIYDLECVVPVDLFPQTCHIESVAFLNYNH